MSKKPLSSDKNHSKNTNAIDRRAALIRLSAIAAGAVTGLPKITSAKDDCGKDARPPKREKVRMIATEEAFMIPEIADALRELVRRGGGKNLDLKLLSTIYDPPPLPKEQPQPAATNRDALVGLVLPKLLDVDKERLADMDASGVDMHLLSLSMPGVQMFEKDKAIALARLSNDRLKETIDRHPKRFAGLAAFTPQDPKAAAKEMERAINTLKLNGFLVNSHTANRYLDEQEFYPILEAADAL